MYFSGRTDKTKIIQLQNQVEALQAALNSKAAPPADQDLQKQISKLLEENKSLKEEIESLKSQLVEVPQVVEEEIVSETISEEALTSEQADKQIKPKKGNKQK